MANQARMQRWGFVLSAAVLTAFVSAGCSHEEPRTEAVGAERKAASVEDSAAQAAPATHDFHRHISEEEAAAAKEVVRRQDSKRLGEWFRGLKMSQVLVSSFDLRIQKLQSGEDADRLFQSNLYCKLWSGYLFHRRYEELLKTALQGALELGPNSERWYYEQLMNFGRHSMSGQAALGNLVRELVASEVEICGAKGCVEKTARELKGFRVSPFMDETFARFLSDVREKIALDNHESKTDLRPGKCFATEERKPNQEASGGYDWKARNWVGSVLPDGEFVFSYDDGPHATRTQAIMSAWQDAGMVKPTFFWLSKNVMGLKSIVQKAALDGYNIGSHSERHPDIGNLAKATSAQELNSVNRQSFASELKALPSGQFAAWKTKTLDAQILGSAATITNAIREVKPDYTMKYFRLPYGSGVKSTIIGDRFQTLNVDHFFWRVDSLDWQDKNPASIRERVLTQMKAVKKGIILFHDIHPQSVEAAKLLIQDFKASSTWKVVPMTKLVPVQ